LVSGDVLQTQALGCCRAAGGARLVPIPGSAACRTGTAQGIFLAEGGEPMLPSFHLQLRGFNVKIKCVVWQKRVAKQRQ